MRDRLRVALWPRCSWQRSARYASLRLARNRATAHQLALGVALGVGIATLPLIGLQMALAVGGAALIRASIPAALMATFWANPITSPPVWLVCYGVGALMLGGEPALAHIESDALAALSALPGGAGLAQACLVALPALLLTLAGSVPVGLLTAAAFYVVTRVAIGRYRAHA